MDFSVGMGGYPPPTATAPNYSQYNESFSGGAPQVSSLNSLGAAAVLDSASDLWTRLLMAGLCWARLPCLR